MTIKKHVHKLKRVTYDNNDKIYFCVDDCTFKINSRLVLGKKTICNRCGREFKIDEISARQAKPHCRACDKKKKITNETDTAEFLNTLENLDVLATNRIISRNMEANESHTPDIPSVISDLRGRLTESIRKTLEPLPESEVNDSDEDIL